MTYVYRCVRSRREKRDREREGGVYRKYRERGGERRGRDEWRTVDAVSGSGNDSFEYGHSVTAEEVGERVVEQEESE